MNAAKKIILLLWLLIAASLGNASALTPGATENRTWEKSFAALETRQAKPLQTADRHQGNGLAAYDVAPDSLLAADTAAAGSRMTTVLGSGRDVASYVGKPGFNTFTGAGIAPAELDTQNALWLNNAIQRGDQLWLVTDPAAHQALMDLKGLQSAYLNLELPMMGEYSGVNAIPKFAPPPVTGVH